VEFEYREQQITNDYVLKVPHIILKDENSNERVFIDSEFIHSYAPLNAGLDFFELTFYEEHGEEMRELIIFSLSIAPICDETIKNVLPKYRNVFWMANMLGLLFSEREQVDKLEKIENHDTDIKFSEFAPKG
jgi:hypothetical protein